MIRSFLPLFRLILAILLISLSSLIFLRSQKIFLFQLTVLATEFGHWLIIFCLTLALLGDNKSSAGLTGTILLTVSALIFARPLLQAFDYAKTVPAQVAAVFPAQLPSEPALAFGKLWCATRVNPIQPQTFIYASHAGENLSLLFYSAIATKPAPCIVVLHTGGWSTGSPQEFLKMNSWLAGQGYAVASIEYRLAPRWKWPAQRDDVLDTFRFLKANREKLKIDPERFVIFGRSAGGQIAEAVAYGSPDPAVRGCISLYAPADLYFAHKYATSTDILNSLKLVEDYTGGTPETAKPNYDSGSPIFLVTPQSPPTLLIHGLRDEMVWMRQNRRLAPVLEKNQVPYVYLEFPWATHAFDYNFDGPGGQISRYAIEKFLSNVTR